MVEKIPYTCPIHKGVTFEELNKCPKCIALEEKKKAFEKHPEQFYHASELIMAAKFDDEGRMMILIHAQADKRTLYWMYGAVTEHYNRALVIRNIMLDEKNKSPIIQPGQVAPPLKKR